MRAYGSSAYEKAGIVCPRLVIRQDVWNRIQAYVCSDLLQSNEINGFGLVTRMSDDCFVLDTAFITKQTVTQGSAESSGFDGARALDYADQQGRGDDMLLQWHSHGKLDAYHSITDMDNIDEYGRGGMTWFISVVTNVYGKVVARLDMFRPVRMGMPMQVSIGGSFDSELQRAVDDEIADLVTIAPLPNLEPEGANEPPKRVRRLLTRS